MKLTTLRLTGFLMVLLLLKVISCQPYDNDDGGVLPDHCQNGIRDNNESRPDCGGDCLPCEPLLECAEEDGSAFFTGLLEGAVTDKLCSEEEGQIVALGTYGTLVLTFTDGGFDGESRKLEMAGCGQLTPGQVCAALRLKAYPGLDFYANGGTLSMFETNEGVRVSFCNVLFYNPSSDVRFYGSMRFVCS